MTLLQLTRPCECGRSCLTTSQCKVDQFSAVSGAHVHSILSYTAQALIRALLHSIRLGHEQRLLYSDRLETLQLFLHTAYG